MKYEVVLTNEADRNARSIIAWYAERSQTAADRWYSEFTAAIASLARNPEQLASQSNCGNSTLAVDDAPPTELSTPSDRPES